MSKIYLPTEYINYQCKVINNDYIRVYTNSNFSRWVDIYVNQDYMLKEGYSNYSNTPTCDTLNSYTDEVYYRVDFPFILLGFIILCIFCFYIPLKIFSKSTRRGSIL